MPRFSILPAEEGFYDWFEKGAANLVEAARALYAMLQDYTDVPASCTMRSSRRSIGRSFVI